MGQSFKWYFVREASLFDAFPRRAYSLMSHLPSAKYSQLKYLYKTVDVLESDLAQPIALYIDGRKDIFNFVRTIIIFLRDHLFY